MPKARKMLSDWKAPYIQSLMKLIETQSKATLTGWAVDYSEGVVLPLWSKYYPDDQRPQNAINAAREWLSGTIKLPQAKAAILECHAAAREAEGNPVAQAAARTIGQCASTIHSPRHCIGLAFYGAIAVAYDRIGIDAPWGQIEQCAAEECGRMEAALREVAVEKEPNPSKIQWSVEKRKLTPEQQEELFKTLKTRFEGNRNRHKGLDWTEVEAKLKVNADKLWALYEMEKTGGEPDVVAQDVKAGGYVFFDCSEETPKGRRNVCYDREALESRKENKPQNSAIDMAADMGIDILTEEQYRKLQEFGNFDTKTSSWVKTPEPIRKLGGAIFCDRRYDAVFVYHNGAESYYATRGFRGGLHIR